MRRTASRAVASAMLCALALLGLGVSPASAHVVPTSSVFLEVGTASVAAEVSIPLSDVESAVGIDLGDQTQAEVDTHTDLIKAYLLDHVKPTNDDGSAWSVVDNTPLVVSAGGTASTTGVYAQLRTTLTLRPPSDDGAEQVTDDLASFNLGYDAVVDKVATHVAIVTARVDGGDVTEVGVVRRSTVTNTVQALHVDLTANAPGTSVISMVHLGVRHIAEGTDHQLFLLTLLLPAPLLARAGRWSGTVRPRRSLHRIASITLAFTLGHSITLALGTFGLPIPQGLVESLIAVSILVAAAHAVRPLFPGREALVAACFGLVHGLAFSETLRALDLTGSHLLVALLGFNLGIELMQLVVVALVLPPLVLLARSNHYSAARVAAAGVTATAAAGWLAARLGHTNAVAELADQLGSVSAAALVVLWSGAIVQIVCRRRHRTLVVSRLGS